MSETEQTSLARSPDRQLVEVERDESEGIRSPLRCPDCGQDISASKGAHRTPGGRRTHGWYCGQCNNVAPCHAHSLDAPSWNEKIEGIEATFRDGSARVIPVVKEATE